jgi:glycosyltransferase involved in cell wall biosynthesis
MKILDIVGPYPPPIGGISVHISRMEVFLKNEGIPYRIFNHGFLTTKEVIATNKSYFWYLKYLFTQKGTLVHFHQFNVLHYFYYFVFSRISSSKLIVTIHEENLLYYNSLLRKIVIHFLRNTNFTALISVSSNLSDFLNQCGIPNIWLPAYVPPSQFERILVQPKDTRAYFLYSVWKFERTISKTIYNIDLAFQFCKLVKGKYQMLLLIGTEEESDKNYLTDMLRYYDIADSVTVIFEAELVSYLNNCKFLLRVNKVDGYGISLQEALDLGIPAIATDVCIRPRGCILFRNDDIDDLMDKVNNLDKYWNRSEVASPDYHLQLIELYKKHLQ